MALSSAAALRDIEFGNKIVLLAREQGYKFTIFNYGALR
jgi:hypothetical protein